MINPEYTHTLRPDTPDKHLTSPQNLSAFQETQSLRPDRELIEADLHNLSKGLFEALKLMTEVPSFAMLMISTGIAIGAIYTAFALQTDYAAAHAAAGWFSNPSNRLFTSISMGISGASLLSGTLAAAIEYYARDRTLIPASR